MFGDGKVLEGTVSMPFSVQVLCKETSFQSSSFKRHHIHPSCPLLPHNSCKSTYFSKTILEPKYAQVDFRRQNYTTASYYHRARQSILSNGGFGVFIFFIVPKFDIECCANLSGDQQIWFWKTAGNGLELSPPPSDMSWTSFCPKTPRIRSGIFLSFLAYDVFPKGNHECFDTILVSWFLDVPSLHWPFSIYSIYTRYIHYILYQPLDL